MLVALWMLLRRKLDWPAVIKENASLMVLIVFMLCSVLWSDIPFISFKRWTRELVAVLMAFLVLSDRSPRQALECILRRMTYILIPFSLLLVKYFGVYGVDYERWTGRRIWIGVCQHKNGLGQLCLIAGCFLIWSLLNKWRGHRSPAWKYEAHVEALILLIVFWLMRGPGGQTYSATSVVALLLGVLVYWGLGLARKRKLNLKAWTLMAVVVIIIIVGTSSVFTGGSLLGPLASSAGRNATLTGRTGIWSTLLPIAMERPLLGHGFGGFWTTSRRLLYPYHHSHNGYLEILLTTGFVGLVLISIFLLSSCRKAIGELSQDLSWGALWISFLLAIVIHNITEPSLDNLIKPLTAVIMFFAVSSTNRPARQEAS